MARWCFPTNFFNSWHSPSIRYMATTYHTYIQSKLHFISWWSTTISIRLYLEIVANMDRLEQILRLFTVNGTMEGLQEVLQSAPQKGPMDWLLKTITRRHLHIWLLHSSHHCIFIRTFSGPSQSQTPSTQIQICSIQTVHTSSRACILRSTWHQP